MCGSDGFAYRSVCALQRTACLLGEDIEEVAASGGRCAKPTGTELRLGRGDREMDRRTSDTKADR